ncbi:MAG: DUF342 domain-containing protein, partial [Desulfobacteraceae bacterium]|nr:DUF342 domain-containing protein [Desulfobacteraceae bacterium]
MARNKTNKGSMNSRNALITKIALFLNYLSKKNFQKLTQNLEKYEDRDDIDVLKIMQSQKYVRPKDISNLKNACISFAQIQNDTRFGSLCLDFDFVNESNLKLAIDEQKTMKREGQAVFLGDLLVEAGMISDRQRKLILQKQKLESASRKDGMGMKTAFEQSRPGYGETDTNKPKMTEIAEKEIIFFIQQDFLKAFVIKTDSYTPSFSLKDLKHYMEKNDIIYGIKDDLQLKHFISTNIYKNKLFEVASGLAPIHGTDAKIIYMFETDHLKAGSIGEDGSIDFKDRGEIPYVAEGDLLAEKIPPQEGKDGISIYGDAVPYIAPMDKEMKWGEGARISKDELKVYAEVSGNPRVNTVNEIRVNDSYVIEGDVDFKTGHVKFDKNVFISGTIKSGFQVEAINVVVSTIDGGIVKAEGDVLVTNGIIDASVISKGNIRAGFIHRSRI